ncbi:MAG TPA: serine/threonine-protein kinase [Polyangiaceae bacterium]|jgi:serine/threonine-protein kinase
MSGASPVAIGSTIAGKYRVERVLGQGGMGVVVVAMHDELDQRVAIKFLLPDALSDAEWVARFSREAKAAARIKSEHAVKVYDVGKLETGAPYMVMEYLEGQDLQTILNEKGSLPVSDAVEYLLQACEAIAEAHSAGVVHRDLKPANLFVTHRTDGSSCVKILDFGISKLTPLTDGGAREQTMTNTTAIVGSPLYMSPEQMRASKNVDRRTDIWSLGVILQELVSGAPSFVANTTAELCALVLTAAPSPLALPNAPGLDAVIARCLEKTPEKRYTNVAELAHALERFGPASVKTSVERIARLGGGSRSSLTSAPEPAAQSVVLPAGPASRQVSTLDRTELSDSGATRAPPANPAPAATVVGSGTSAAWGSSNAPAKKSKLPFVIAGGALAAVAVLGGIAFALSGSHPPAPTHASDPVVAEPKPAPVEITTPAVAVTATATATVTATTATTAPAHHPTAAHPTAKPPASGAKHPTAAPLDTSGFGGRN